MTRVRLACALVAALVAGCSAEEDGARPHVLVVVVDTLRADALGVYGSSVGDSPELDAFAETASVYSRASTPRAKTNPAVASLMTGTYPPEHGVRDLSTPLPVDLPTLAESFRDAGYRTVGIVGNYVLGAERSGLDRGFDRWIEEWPDVGDRSAPATSVPERRAPSLTDAAVEALSLAEAGPLFLYLHYMDPHGPYDPPEEHRVEAAAPRPIEVPEAPNRWRPFSLAEKNVPEHAYLDDGRIDASVVRALYRGEVRTVDRELGRLFRELESRGLRENTVVVVTADHGESLGEHDYWFEHGKHAYEATTWVPLMIAGPLKLDPTRLDANVSLVDVAPTLRAELLGAELPNTDDPRGASLGPAGSGSLSPVYSEKAEGNDQSRTMQIDAVRHGRWKLVRRFTTIDPGAAQKRPILADELYDLETDRLEQVDLSQAEGAQLPGLIQELMRWRAFDDAHEDAPERPFTSEELEHLRAMGYLGDAR